MTEFVVGRTISANKVNDNWTVFIDDAGNLQIRRDGEYAKTLTPDEAAELAELLLWGAPRSVQIAHSYTAMLENKHHIGAVHDKFTRNLISAAPFGSA